MPHILIVEDDTGINNSTARYLRRKGCLCSPGPSDPRGGPELRETIRDLVARRGVGALIE